MLFLNGIPASDVGVIVEHRPPRPIPRRRTLSWEVPGRSGRLVRQLDERDNVSLSYDLAVVPVQGRSLSDTVDAAVAWLQQDGWMELYDDADPDVFYLAQYLGGQDLAAVLHRARRARVPFDCLPERRLRSGTVPVLYTAAATIYNPTPNIARPRITLAGSGSGTVTVGERTLSVSNCNGLSIDCDTRLVTGPTGTVTGDFPQLPPGANALSFTGGVTSVTLEARWYVY